MSAPEPAPSEWRGRFFEDFEVGQSFRSRFGRTITETDNVWFTALTHNTNPVHFDAEFAAGTRFGQRLVNSCFTLSLVVGLSVPDTSRTRPRTSRGTASACRTPSSTATHLGRERGARGAAAARAVRRSASSASARAASTSARRSSASTAAASWSTAARRPRCEPLPCHRGALGRVGVPGSAACPARAGRRRPARGCWRPARPVQARLAELALDVVLGGEAEAAVRVEARVGRLPGGLGGEQLGHVRLGAAAARPAS